MNEIKVKIQETKENYFDCGNASCSWTDRGGGGGGGGGIQL